jgi:hypothetical protein
MFTMCWCSYRREHLHSPTPNKHGVCKSQQRDVIYALTVKEIAQAQEDNVVLKRLSKTDNYSTYLVENTQVLCKNCKMVIPKFFNVEQLVVITTTCSILDTHVLKTHYMQRCIGKV